MKKFLPILFALFGVALVHAQGSFFDDMEAYAEGDFIGTKTGWSVWSGSPGGQDDAQITTEVAFSGTNSIKFESYNGGGPADVILPMPYRVSTGSMVFKFQMYVVEGTAAYFNFQGGSSPGQSWASEVYFEDGGNLRVVSNSTTHLTGRFPFDEWFEVEFRVDFNKNAWEAIIGGQCLGTYTNAANLNSIGSVDFYPSNQNAANNTSIFYVDDVSYEISLDGFPDIELDASISDIAIREKALTGQEVPISGSVRNNGVNEITSFDVEFDAAGQQFSESIDNVNIAPGETYEFTTQESYTYREGNYALTMSLTAVNGGADEKTCNDERTVVVSGVTPAAGKQVLAEEATGTWCQWCPRGDIFIKRMEEAFGDFFVPIAVHDGDPMENEHIGYITTAIPGFTGYPNMVVDRTGWFSFPTLATVENYFFDGIETEVAGTVDIGAEWDGSNLKVSTGVNFMADSESGMSVDVILVEDNVTGTGAGYNQVNAYSGGANGEMGGYENLPNPVPAADMVYGHVSRGSFTDYTGNAIDGTFGSGDRFLTNFEATISDDYDRDELYLVAIVSNSDGTVNNTKEVSLQDALDNGFEMATNSEDISVSREINVYPNPAQNRTFVRLDLIETSHVRINVINTMGAVVASRDYGHLSGEYDFPVDLSNMTAGAYQVQILVDDEYTSRTVNVIK